MKIFVETIESAHELAEELRGIYYPDSRLVSKHGEIRVKISENSFQYIPVFIGDHSVMDSTNAF